MTKIVWFSSVAILAIAFGCVFHIPSSLLYAVFSHLIGRGEKINICLLSKGIHSENLFARLLYSEMGCASTGSVVLVSDFKPLNKTTMTKDLREASLTMRGLFKWNNSHQHNISIEIGNFFPFLPSSDKGVGHTWYILEPIIFDINEVLEHDMSMRYLDEKPQNNSAAWVLYHILSMFHKNVFLQTRFTPRGTVAVLRAQNSEFLDIMFRCHAEFQLNDPPLLPFWFTPAQFQGELIITKDATKINNFSMIVPTNQKLNVDMEWYNKLHEDMEVDIGFIPQMTVHIADVKGESIVWNEQISMDEAYNILDKRMFNFKEVLYKPIAEALTELSGQQRPLHCVVLWGALDDQSC